MTSDISAFVLARAAEREAVARAADAVGTHPASRDPMFGARAGDIAVGQYWAKVADPERALREVAAVRAIVAALRTARQRKKVAWRNYQRWADGKPDRRYPVLTRPDPGEEKHIAGLELAVRMLAEVDRDHRDFDPSWDGARP